MREISKREFESVSVDGCYFQILGTLTSVNTLITI